MVSGDNWLVDANSMSERKEKGQILTSYIKQSRSFSYCNLTFLSSSINAFNLPTVLDIAE